MPRLSKFLIALIGLNLIGLDAWLIYNYYQKTPIAERTIENNSTQYVDQCGTDCQKYITDKLALYKLPTPRPTSPSGTVAPVPTRTLTTSVSYAPVPGSGSTTANDWADLPGTDFYFNLSDYPGLQSIYFLTNIRLLNGNGQAFIRLFDVTHGIGVQGSEVSTSSQTSVPVESGQVSFWQGKILLRVQAKSLTADTAIFDSGRLKITTRN